MTTKLTLESAPRHSAGKALEPHVPDFAARSGHTIVGIAELRRTKITTVDDGTGDDTVKAALLTFEPAPAEAGHQLREAALALRMLRNAEGTLTGDMDVELAETTMKHLAGMIGFEEAARLKVGVKHWLDILLAAISQPRSKITLDELLDDVQLAAMGLGAVLDGVTEPGERASDDTPPGVDPSTGEIRDPETDEESGYDGPTSPDLPPGHPGYRPDSWTDPGSASYGTGEPDRDDLHDEELDAADEEREHEDDSGS